MNTQYVDGQSREPRLILLFCLFAVLHVLVFSAAFPFFNNVDEKSHFDLVLRYAEGSVPATIDPFGTAAIPYLVLYSSPEYLQSPARLPNHPLWKQPAGQVRQQLPSLTQSFREESRNHEDSQPPLYYAVAGAWWQTGKLLKMEGLILLYWLRFLNALLVVGMVCCGWQAARKIFPENGFIHIAVPAFIAFMPQTAFYSINNDVLSPLVFGGAFVLLLKCWETEMPAGFLPAAGLALAAAFLTKISNLPLLIIAAIFLTLTIFRLVQTQKWRASLLALVIMADCLAFPLAAWMTWCKLRFGDLTGSALKIQYLGWTNKRFADWWHHPIFTPHGFGFFVSRNLSSFWQGEIVWHGRPLSCPGLNWFYVLLSIGGLCFAFCSLLKPGPNASPLQRPALCFAFACVASTFVFFALLSVKFDFHQCWYPSREHPYFVSGRLMLGLVVPFMVLLACGLDRVLRKFSPALKYLVLGLLLAFMLASEIALDWQVFLSDYNLYHI
jgi:4-amino-4-deoxy-L-arabinose transferase-like glycosyltransferase